ncbi:MAG: F0F1 ATP synthase subunit A [Coriobacteriales bacterium]|nr:F0F1 ATP synthase subunit A [Coriobacteriales bacterium]
MGPLEHLDSEIKHLLKALNGEDILNFGWGSITTYTVWIVIVSALLLAVVLFAKSKMTLVPKKNFAAAIEAVVEYIRREIGESILGHDANKHMPFLLTIFFFILASNLVGLIPGAKAATGTFSATLVLAVVSFIYFNYWGLRHAGLLPYVKNLAPAGLIPGVNVLVWLIEVFSLFLRIATLSLRLFANMYAGHIVLGTFAILTTLFAFPAIQEFTLANLAGAAPALGWVLLLIAMYAMELLVAFIQAYVFTLLSAVYIQLATSEH